MSEVPLYRRAYCGTPVQIRQIWSGQEAGLTELVSPNGLRLREDSVARVRRSESEGGLDRTGLGIDIENPTE